MPQPLRGYSWNHNWNTIELIGRGLQQISNTREAVSRASRIPRRNQSHSDLLRSLLFVFLVSAVL